MTSTLEAKVRAITAAQSMPLRQAGPFLAANGIPVFPCAEAGKTPLVAHGLLDATVDGRIAEQWWRHWPTANIGMPTGPVSGFDVVDVDVRDTGSGYERFHQAGTSVDVDGWVVRVLTPSGGMHFYYPTTPGKAQRCWASSRAHVDFRGAGGYVILPPSVGVCGHEIRQPYQVVETRSSPRPIDAERLRESLDPEWARRRFTTRLTRLPLADARVSALRSWVAARPEGERNTGLFWAACRMAEAGHDYTTTLDALSDSAIECGLRGREITATIRSAYRHTNPNPVTGVSESGSNQPASVDRGLVMVL